MFAKLATLPRHHATTQSLLRSTCRAMHYRLPWEKEQQRSVPETAVIPDHIGWVTINEGTWKAEMARQAPCVPFTVGSWWAIDTEDTVDDENNEEGDPKRMELMNRNSRFGKAANGGKRACSRQRRRSKRRAFGNHRR